MKNNRKNWVTAKRARRNVEEMHLLLERVDGLEVGKRLCIKDASYENMKLYWRLRSYIHRYASPYGLRMKNGAIELWKIVPVQKRTVEVVEIKGDIGGINGNTEGSSNQVVSEV